MAERLELHYALEHEKWMDISEIELSVLARQCMNHRIETIEPLRDEVQSWKLDKNNQQTKVSWQFTCAIARGNFEIYSHLYSVYYILVYFYNLFPKER
jgi:recombinational DNA repair ATPase RecF